MQDQLDKNVATLISSGETGSAAVCHRDQACQFAGGARTVAADHSRAGRYSKDEFQILQQESLANLEEQLTDPQSLGIAAVRQNAQPLFQRTTFVIFPHPKKKLPIPRLSKSTDLRSCYSEFLGGQAGELSVVGDFEVDETVKELKQMFSGWTAKQPYERIPKIVFNNVKGVGKRSSRPTKPTRCILLARCLP